MHYNLTYQITAEVGGRNNDLYVYTRLSKNSSPSNWKFVSVSVQLNLILPFQSTQNNLADCLKLPELLSSCRIKSIHVSKQMGLGRI